jgi:hypothetical protein
LDGTSSWAAKLEAASSEMLRQSVIAVLCIITPVRYGMNFIRTALVPEWVANGRVTALRKLEPAQPLLGWADLGDSLPSWRCFSTGSG